MNNSLNNQKPSRFSDLARRLNNWLHEFVSGAALSWAAAPYILHRRQEMENLFILSLILNLEGLSPLPSRYRLWLLAEVTPQILYWRRRLLFWDDSLETADLKHLGH